MNALSLVLQFASRLLIPGLIPEGDKLMLLGHHDCAKERVDSILENNFECTESEEAWLGKGAYFFGEGISDPEDDARRWACKASVRKGFSNASTRSGRF